MAPSVLPANVRTVLRPAVASSGEEGPCASGRNKLSGACKAPPCSGSKFVLNDPADPSSRHGNDRSLTVTWTRAKLQGRSPRDNHIDRANATNQHLLIDSATWSAWRIPTAVFSVFCTVTATISCKQHNAKRDTFYPQKFTLTSPTNGGHWSV
jgi:hypothetical protein